jgi:hypothetical protein
MEDYSLSRLDGTYSTHGENNAYTVLVGKTKGRDQGKDISVDGRITLQMSFMETRREVMD